MADQLQPIIIKKIKKGGHGHHGGAWKVAYADFVTAMMAFFLLLWLLNVTTKTQKTGIADYFTPTTGVKDAKGIGFRGGEASNPGNSKSDLSQPGIIFGAPPTGSETQESEEKKEAEYFARAESEIKREFTEDPELNELKNHLIIDMTPEGLRIQIIDQNNRSMFRPGSAALEEVMRRILAKVTEVIVKIPNKLSIAGHTDASAYPAGATYTNWELSADRANASRRFMLSNKMPEARIFKVAGMASKELLDVADPSSVNNRRISIVLLKKSLAPVDMPAPKELMEAPKANEPKPNLNIKPKTLGD